MAELHRFSRRARAMKWSPVASVGLPFVFVEVRDRETLARARIDANGFEALRKSCAGPDILFYTRTGDEFDLQARMFAPFDGIPEDPATGSANCCLAGLLAHYKTVPEGTYTWRITQGVEMGRPSLLVAEAYKRGGSVVETRVGGHSVMVCDGYTQVEENLNHDARSL